jgi:hypothetical protein
MNEINLSKGEEDANENSKAKTERKGGILLYPGM